MDLFPELATAPVPAAAPPAAAAGRPAPLAEPGASGPSGPLRPHGPERPSDGGQAPDRPSGAAAADTSRAVPVPETLHPALWLGHQLGRLVERPVPSGHALLDAQLPGGGWPRRALTELLLGHPGIGEIRLVAPCLVAAQAEERQVMLFDPPAQLSAPALASLGLDLAQLLVVSTRTRVIPGADSLWALEQALKSGHVGAVVAWLPPRLRAERLRRLQLAAQAHDGPAFVMRELEARHRPTAAPLRLGLRPGGGDALVVQLLKRRGPPLETPLRLALPPVLPAAALRRLPADAPVEAGVERVPPMASTASHADTPHDMARSPGLPSGDHPTGPTAPTLRAGSAPADAMAAGRATPRATAAAATRPWPARRARGPHPHDDSAPGVHPSLHAATFVNLEPPAF
jgi:protein ImuA